MESEQLVTALNAVIHRLVLLATEDAQLRTELRRLAEAVLEITGAPEQQATLEPAVEGPSAVQVTDEAPSPALVVEPVAAPAPAVPQEAGLFAPPAVVLPELTLGQAKPAVEPAPVCYPERWFRSTDFDLALVETRCRLKIEGARWAATRRRLLAEGANFRTDIEPKDQDIISRAKAIPDCFLWMSHPSGPSPSDPKLYEDVAHCFEAVADAVSLLRQLQDEPETLRNEFERSLDLLAEAQSALRAAIDIIDGPTDTDQTQVFNWLKATANERQIYIERYMRADDPADPGQWADLSARIEALDSDVQEIRERNKKRRKSLGKVRHKASLIAANPKGAEGEWATLVSTVEELVGDGMPPSNRELRELLVPIIDDLPELADVPPGFQSVLREIDRFMAAYPPPETKVVMPPIQPVQDVAKLLNNKSLVMIGGDRRGGAYQAIKDAFGLKELIWIETREHQSIDGFEPYVARPEVAAVLLAIRWSSHSFSEVRAFCDRHGKPLVRLPGGYGLNQVAAQIMAQCSERLPSP
jgi:hypothetical protein